MFVNTCFWPKSNDGPFDKYINYTFKIVQNGKIRINTVAYSSIRNSSSNREACWTTKIFLKSYTTYQNLVNLLFAKILSLPIIGQNAAITLAKLIFTIQYHLWHKVARHINYQLLFFIDVAHWWSISLQNNQKIFTKFIHTHRSQCPGHTRKF